MPVRSSVAHLRRGRVVDLARDVHERGLGRGEAVLERELVDADDRRDHRGVTRGILDQARVRGDRGLRYRDREVDTVAVEDRTARRRERDGLQALADAERRELAPIARLELEEADAERAEREHHRHEQHAETQADGRVDLRRPLRTWRSAGRRATGRTRRTRRPGCGAAGGGVPGARRRTRPDGRSRARATRTRARRRGDAAARRLGLTAAGRQGAASPPSSR